MKQYLVCNSSLVSASRTDGKEVADYEEEYNDVGLGLEVLTHGQELLTQTQIVNVEVLDASGVVVTKSSTTLSRQNYYENTDALFEYLTSQLPFDQWSFLMVFYTDINPESVRLFPYSLSDTSLNSTRLAVRGFCKDEMLWIDDDAEDWSVKLQYAMQGDFDRLPAVTCFTFRIHAKGYRQGGGGGGLCAGGAAKRVKP
jgi:hypothetical protein